MLAVCHNDKFSDKYDKEKARRVKPRLNFPVSNISEQRLNLNIYVH